MSYVLTGQLKVKFDAEQVSEKFKRRNFVVTDNSSQYPQEIQFQLAQDKCSLLDPFRVGQDIKVHFNLRGREYTGKDGKVSYFTSLDAWKIESMASDNAPAESRSADIYTGKSDFVDDSENLPF